MLVDLHAHYPMHVTEGKPPTVRRALRKWREERAKARLVNLISWPFNYEGPRHTPGVTIELMNQGKVGVALSVLYIPWTEIDFQLPYGSPPKDDYLHPLLHQLEDVENSVKGRDDVVCPVKTRAQLDSAVKDEKLALVHCVEGGYVLGADKQAIERNVATLADRGVAYITVAHLFWRRMATNAPALPMMPDRLYRWLFPQPDDFPGQIGDPEDRGLSKRGKDAIRAMCKKRILIDMSHMSAASINETLDLLDEEIDPKRQVPVIATHSAYRFKAWPRFRRLGYNFDDDTIQRIAARGGVIGLIACRHYISRGLRPWLPWRFEHAVDLLCSHIDRIRDLTSIDHVAIGSDLDGFIKPALPGLKHMGRMDELQQALHDRYGADAEKICSLNALRVLHHRFA